MSDGDEQPGDRELGLCAGDGVDEADTLDPVVAGDGGDPAVPCELDAVIGDGAVGHDPRGAQLVATVDDRDVGRELGEEQCFLDCGVAAADYGDVLVPEEEPVTGRTGREPVAQEALFFGEAQHGRLGAGRHDHRPCPVLGVAHKHSMLARGGEFDAGGFVGDELGAEPDGLGPHPSHELGSHDPVGEPGEVLDLGGQHQLAAGLVTSR